uniref:Interleukin enhancer binding factor 3a n=1 Tax=Cyclopterus lumpus TaxID=8103 RepID=A0A8C2YY97_CYCLU
VLQTLTVSRRREPPAAVPSLSWDEHQAYEELLYWDSLIQQGHRLLPHDFDRYEDLRYWYDCLCYEEELRQYHDYMAVIEDIEDHRHHEEAAVPQVRAGPHDRHVMAKHSEVYPSPEELEAVQSIVSRVECALKTVSDQMDTPKDNKLNTDVDSQERILRGVMRVGLVAKGLLLTGDKDLELVLLCSKKPTITLLNKVGSAEAPQTDPYLSQCSVSPFITLQLRWCNNCKCELCCHNHSDLIRCITDTIQCIDSISANYATYH